MRLTDVRLALIFKDFAMWCRTSCVGLHVAGYATAEVLGNYGIETVAAAVRHNVDLVDFIEKYNEEHDKPLTHVVISAPWLSSYDLEKLLSYFRHTQFVILSHSNVGFLQADSCGMHLLRRYHELARHYHNLKIGGNSFKFAKWMKESYGDDVVLLPNLYPLNEVPSPKVWDQVSPLKIGAFGAVRPQKNFMTAAAAAVVIHRRLCIPVEFHMSEGGEGDFNSTSRAIDEMLHGTGVTIVRHKWCYWDDFVKLVATMDLMIQVSYTESFNMITADGISVGVPSVVSPAIYWAPAAWKADPDNALDVAVKGIYLLVRHHQLYDGIKALELHNVHSWKFWKEFLEGRKTKDKGSLWRKFIRIFG